MSLDKLLEINQKGKRRNQRDFTVIGHGVELSNIYKEIDIVIPDRDRNGHFGCFGTTRTGKTKLIESIVEQDISKGLNVVVIDPKGDIELFSRVVQASAESGRLEEVMFLSPIYTDYSIMLDPLAYYYMEDELVDHVISGIRAREDYFIAIAYEVTQAVVAGLALDAKQKGQRLNISFKDIKERSDWHNLKNFMNDLKQISGSKEIVTSIEQILNSPPDFFSKVSSSLRTTLSALTSGSTGKIIGKTYVNEFVKRFEKGKGVILFCNTGSMLARRTAHIIGRVLISMIQSMLGRFYASGRKLDPPLSLHIDEGHNMLYKGIEELFNKGGAANVYVHFYTQSIAQIEEEVGREAARSIVDNVNTWVYMLVNHPETAKFIEQSSPKVKKFQPVLSFGGGITVREMEENRITAQNILRLPKRHFYMRSYGKLYRGITKEVEPPYVRVEFPHLSGPIDIP
jgi:type IV secretory pathway TraG/TraD family ATPase VirD4